MPVVGTRSPGLRGPAGIFAVSEQGTIAILLSLLLSRNGPIALTLLFLTMGLATEFSLTN
jgi:hypothetical protein